MSPSGMRSSGIEQRLATFLRDAKVTSSPRPLIVAFSGGPDSLALAASLGSLRRRLDIAIHLVHVNHGLRANASSEADRCQELALQLELPLSVVLMDVAAVGQVADVGTEAAARMARYLGLSEECLRLDGQALLTAHHLQDQAETVLLHLLRGSGLRGAAGMRADSLLPIPWWITSRVVSTFRVLRPFLKEPRTAIEGYLADLNLSPNRDETNLSLAFRRNAIRHRVLPVLESEFPGSTDTLARFGFVVADDAEYLDHIAAMALDKALMDRSTLPYEALLTQPVSIQRRMVAFWLKGCGASEPTFERIEATRTLAASPIPLDRRRRLQVGNGIEVRQEATGLVCLSQDQVPASAT